MENNLVSSPYRNSCFYSIETLISSVIVSSIELADLDLKKYLSINLELISSCSYSTNDDTEYWRYYSLLKELQNTLDIVFCRITLCNKDTTIHMGYSIVNSTEIGNASSIKVRNQVYTPILVY